MKIVGPAYDPAEALRLAEKIPVDVAFVDINLNGHEEGIQVAKILREKKGVFSLVTGQVTAARERGFESIGVLSKPYSLDDLVSAALIDQSWLAGERASIPILPRWRFSRAFWERVRASCMNDQDLELTGFDFEHRWVVGRTTR